MNNNIAELISAARSVDDLPLRAVYAAQARNRLEASKEDLRLLELSLSSVERELVRLSEQGKQTGAA